MLSKIKFRKIILVLAVIVITVGSSPATIYAVSSGQQEDVLRSSEWTDGESSICSTETATTQSANISTPGKIFVLGDSIGQGLAPELSNDLKPEDGWSVQSNSRVGRPLKEGIDIAKNNEIENIKSAQYILVVLGANPDSKLNGSGIQEMIEAIRSAPTTVPILWLGINVSRQDLVAGASDFNRLLKSSSQIRYIENTVSPGQDQLHPSSYDLLSNLVAETFRDGITVNSEDEESSRSCVCNFGNPTGLNVDINLSLGSEGQERRTNLIKLLIGDYNLSAEQASGVVGNFMAESGGEHLPPDINEGGTQGPPRFSGGYGWAQWTGGRQRSFIDFAIEAGFMASESVNATDAANYAYLKKELDEGYKETINDLKKQNNPEDAAVSFERTFERAGVPALEKRKSGAKKAFDEYATGASSGGVSSTGSGNACIQGSAAIVGDSAFPLITTKSNILNKGMFKDGTSNQGEHPYIAYDIITQENIPVAAFLSGKVTQITQDRCPGRMISVYNAESNLTISYLHLAFDNHAAVGDELLVGQQLGLVGAAANGCGTIHLHIDAAEGSSRPGCSRLKCTDANKKRFRDIGSPLFETFQKLAE